MTSSDLPILEAGGWGWGLIIWVTDTSRSAHDMVAHAQMSERGTLSSGEHSEYANLTLGLSRGMNGVTQKELTFPLLLWGLSDPRIAELREMPRCFNIKLHSETQVSGRLGISGGRSPRHALRHAQNPLSGERKKTLSITHHALSPPPSHHHQYIISSHQLTTTFLSYNSVT